MRNVVCTSKAPGVGPYSQAVRGGGFICVSGQLALNPGTRQIIEGDARQQTEQSPFPSLFFTGCAEDFQDE